MIEDTYNYLAEQKVEQQPFNTIDLFNSTTPEFDELPGVRLLNETNMEVAEQRDVIQQEQNAFTDTFIDPNGMGVIDDGFNAFNVPDPIDISSERGGSSNVLDDGGVGDLGLSKPSRIPSGNVSPVKVSGNAHKKRSDIPYNGVAASIRYNNPAAAYPRASDNKYGLIGYGKLNGGKQGTHKIGRFPSPIHGGAANFDLFASNYKGLTLRQAVSKWRGNAGRGEKVVVPKGYNPNQKVNSGFLNDPKRAVDFFRKMAQHETGSKQAMSNAQWLESWKMWRAGGATNYQKQKG